MMIPRFKRLSLLFLVCILSFGTPLWAEEYLLGPLDILEISVLEHNDLTRVVAVDPEGFISYPLAGTLQVAGLTVSEVGKKIAAILGREYLVNPQVTVSVKEFNSRRFFVYGEVKNPGSYSLATKTTLLQGIAMAGGLTEYAAQGRLRILRQKRNGDYEVIKVNLKTNLNGRKEILLQPEDVIIVPETFF